MKERLKKATFVIGWNPEILRDNVKIIGSSEARQTSRIETDINDPLAGGLPGILREVMDKISGTPEEFKRIIERATGRPFIYPVEEAKPKVEEAKPEEEEKEPETGETPLSEITDEFPPEIEEIIAEVLGETSEGSDVEATPEEERTKDNRETDEEEINDAGRKSKGEIDIGSLFTKTRFPFSGRFSGRRFDRPAERPRQYPPTGGGPQQRPEPLPDEVIIIPEEAPSEPAETKREEKQTTAPAPSRQWYTIDEILEGLESNSFFGMTLTKLQKNAIEKALPQDVKLVWAADSLGEERNVAMVPHAVGSEFLTVAKRIANSIEEKYKKLSQISESITEFDNPIGMYGVLYASAEPISVPIRHKRRDYLQKADPADEEEVTPPAEEITGEEEGTPTAPARKLRFSRRGRVATGYLLARGVVILYYQLHVGELARFEGEKRVEVREVVRDVNITSHVVFDENNLYIVQAGRPLTTEAMREILNYLKELVSGGESEEETPLREITPDNEERLDSLLESVVRTYTQPETSREITPEQIEELKNILEDEDERKRLEEKIAKIAKETGISPDEVLNFIEYIINQGATPSVEEIIAGEFADVEDKERTDWWENILTATLESGEERPQKLYTLKKDLTQQLAKYMMERIRKSLKP